MFIAPKLYLKLSMVSLQSNLNESNWLLVYKLDQFEQCINLGDMTWICYQIDKWGKTLTSRNRSSRFWIKYKILIHKHMKLISIEKKKYNWKYSESTFFGSDISNELKLVLHIDYDVIIVNSEQETFSRIWVSRAVILLELTFAKFKLYCLPNNLPQVQQSHHLHIMTEH